MKGGQAGSAGRPQHPGQYLVAGRVASPPGLLVTGHGLFCDDGCIVEHRRHLIGGEGPPQVEVAGSAEEVPGIGGVAVEIVEYEPTGGVEGPVVEAAEVDGVGVVDRATVEQGTQPRFPAHEAQRVAPDGLQSGCVEHCRRRVEVGDQPQPRLEVDAADRVGRLLALDQFDGAVAGHESPTASRGAHAETAQRFDVGPGEGAVPGRDPLREADGV